MYCCVSGCKNNNLKNKSVQNVNKIRYFRFPQDKYFSQKWVTACKQKRSINIKTARICSNHFTEDDFKNFKNDLLNIPIEKRRLNLNAIPTENLSSTPVLEVIKERSKRYEEKERKRMVDEILVKDELDENAKKQKLDEDSFCNKQHETQCNVDEHLSMSETINELMTTCELLKLELNNLKKDNINKQKKMDDYNIALETNLNKILMPGQYRKI